MKRPLHIVMTLTKVITGILLGLLFSFTTIVLLEILIPKPNPFQKERVDLWLIAPIIAGWLFVMLWLMLFKRSSNKMHTPGIEQLPISISDLIDAVIDTMGYRRSARTEVRQELTDHFTDALADCDNEQEKQTRIQALIGEFGDIELLGTLIRRGKKRCQPVWLKILTHIPHAVGVFIVLLVLYIGWFFTGKPQVTHNYLTAFNEQVRPAVDESLNAWPYYEQSAKQYIAPLKINPKTHTFITTPDEEPSVEPIELDDTPRRLDTLSEPEMQILNRWLADNRHHLHFIREGNQRPYCWRTYTCDNEKLTELINVLMPHLSETKRLTYLLCWQGFEDADQGNFEKAYASVLEAYSMGKHIRGQNTTLIEQLVAMAIENLSTNTMRTLLQEYAKQMDTLTLRQIRQQYQALIEKEDFTVGFKSEKLLLYDEIQRCFTESRFGKSHLYIPRIRMLSSPDILDDDIPFVTAQAFHILFTHPDKEETLKTVDTFYDEMEVMASKAPATLKAENIDIQAHFKEIATGNFLLQVLTPAIGKVLELSYRNQLDSHATLAVLAIFEYRKAYEHLPETLEQLVEKELLSTVPTDPFSNESLIYRQTDDGFTLYSVGRNGTDDGGIPATHDDGKPRRWGNHGDWIFWPIQTVNSHQ